MNNNYLVATLAVVALLLLIAILTAELAARITIALEEKKHRKTMRERRAECVRQMEMARNPKEW
jgi:hypothetical protein